MYRYDEFDEAIVRDRIAQFRAQVARRLDGSLSEEEFVLIRQMNGLYLQLHAYMLRVAIPYGTLNSRQARQLALIAERYDRGYGHFTTRQNIQFNWPRLIDVPEILELLADVQMHCIQTSGNCIRNVTADHLAGAAADEIEDPRPTAELIRQWSTLHPEFSYLPRKFKIAVSGAVQDRAVLAIHDIGVQIVYDEDRGGIGYRISVGGGMGRTPMLAKVIRDFLPKEELLSYLEAILRAYNLAGRRDNKHKARIKILIHEIGIDAFRERVERIFARLDRSAIEVDAAERARIAAYFAPPPFADLPAASAVLEEARRRDSALDAFARTNIIRHRHPAYAALTVSTKPIGGVPGDVTAAQLRVLADLAETYSFDELRIAHTQNVVLPHVRLDDVPAVWARLVEAGLATANAGLVTDIIACPGMDYCKLATARSIPIAQAISERFADPARAAEIGPVGIKISGCINACGHHHVGNIGILGLERQGIENYQITIGGDATELAALGERIGPGVDAEAVPEVIERILATYLAERAPGETFADTVRRIGIEPFRPALAAPKEAVREAA